MLNTDDFENNDDDKSTFDFKGFLLKILAYWPWFVLCWIVGLTIAYQVNIRKEKIYSMESTISIKEESNPFFTSNTSLVFNWGGGSDAVQSIISTLKSRTHNEIVVNKLQYFINQQKQGDYNIVDAYGEVPFTVNIDKIKNQLLNTQITVKFITATEYEIFIPFSGENITVCNYNNNQTSNISIKSGDFRSRFRIGQQVTLPFLNWKLELNDNINYYIGKEYLISFNDFDSTVAQYRTINVEIDKAAGSQLKLSMQGNNKARMVTYLNTTAEVLRNNQLALKNQFATNTIRFIDSTLIAMEAKIKNTSDELKDFRKVKNIYTIEGGGIKIADKLVNYDLEKDEINRKLSYYNSLRNYLKNNSDFSKLPAPSVVGIEDPNISANVSKLIALSIERIKKYYTTKNEKQYEIFDVEMGAIKKVLLDNIVTARAELEFDLKLIDNKISKSEFEIKQLPEDEQDLLKIQRKYSLIDNIYTSFLAKKSEAVIIRAANVSDIKFVDNAKDIGGGLIGPKTGVNYVLAIIAGLLLPLIFISIIFFTNSTIKNTEELKKLTSVPIIGIIGKKTNKSNLSVFEKPKSAMSESFRALRSSLQFLYKKQDVNGAKVLMLTSSVGGEGKTYCSLNIATVFAMSQKKTVIVGLDLRKPKLFDDFDFKNEKGVVNYLIGQFEIDEIIQQTIIPNLDIISSGPVPPNPSELILSDAMSEMIEELKLKYDYIILDTPPVGLVSDALEISNFADLTLYIVRQLYTKKDMISLLNTRLARGEMKNVSIILNDFVNKAKFGYSYGYGYGHGYGIGYGYGYGGYTKGYIEDEKPKSKFIGYFKDFKRVVKKLFKNKK